MNDIKIYATEIEKEAKDQIQRTMDHTPLKQEKIRIMPDCHAGAGCVIGFTSTMRSGIVIPNLVGVDIGCGMLTIRLGKIDIDFEKLDEVIRENIPSGFNVREDEMYSQPAFETVLRLKCGLFLKNQDRLFHSLGTLGGGNHFIEIDEDEEGEKYLIIHTGSRNLGKQVAEFYQKLAIDSIYTESIKEERKEIIERMKAEGREKEIEQVLKTLTCNPDRPPHDLCWLEGKNADCYLHDVELCRTFAKTNRFAIADTIIEKMEWMGLEYFTTEHNYIEDGIIRKGAISAFKGERVLIPINMRDGCIIGIGNGNADWNCSAPHGAGRLMSRADARKNLDMSEYKETMNGIYSTCVCESTIDESPMAYKSMDMILECIKPTVEVERIIKPIYNYKATE